MKFTYQVRTGDFEYINGELEGSPEEAVEAYKALQKAYKPGSGLPEPQWRKVLDEYLNTGTVANGAELWGDMSEFQRAVCQELKKCLKRAEGKETN